jgi:hypothetical protein
MKARVKYIWSSRASHPVSSCRASYKKRPYTIRAPSTYGKKHMNKNPDANEGQCLLEYGTVPSDKNEQKSYKNKYVQTSYNTDQRKFLHYLLPTCIYS